VRYSAVEHSVIEGVDRLVVDCPTGAPEWARVTDQISAIDDEISHLGDEVAKLLAHAGRVRSPAIANQIVSLEQEIDKLRAEQAELLAYGALLMPARLSSRLDSLETAAKADPLERGPLNAALRSLMSGVVVNYRTGHLEFRWQHGGETHVLFAWPDDPG
jgi:hypothetical protein